MAIGHDDLTGIDEPTARRVLLYARSIAPCLDSLEGEPKADAVAVLLGVAREVVSRGSRLVASQGVGSARVSYRDVASAFGVDDRAALRALCGLGPSGGLPVGSFPKPGLVGGVWPEESA